MRNLNTREAVGYLKRKGAFFSKGTLEVWRCLGKGPRFKKISGKIFYELEALDDFLKGQEVETVGSVVSKTRGRQIKSSRAQK
jgi:hypothetical protein